MDIHATCTTCKQNRYANGELVQNVWPQLTDAEHEIIIGFANEFHTCSNCWDNLFADTDKIGAY